MVIPSSSYRIQFSPTFTFKHLADISEYLEDLGITAIYASPLLQPTRGSEHGYDGINPAALNPELGTIEELETLSSILRSKGISWIQDIVPNHMAFNTSNMWLRDVFERGINSSYASHFDIDWDHPFYQSKLMVPFLEAELKDCIADGKIKLAFGEDGFSIDHYQSSYPVNPEAYPLLLSGCVPEEESHINAAISALINNKNAPEAHWRLMKTDLLKYLQEESILTKIRQQVEDFNSDPQRLNMVLNQQHYKLCIFTLSHTEVNYRRFFNVNGLISLRVEDENVFNDYHAFTYEMYKKGIITGLRIDHIDGLKNPRQYIDRLRAMFGDDCYIIIEKILDAKEELPALNIEGTSGYEFLSYINQLITDTKGAEKLLDIYTQYVPQANDFDSIVFANKLSNLESYLNGEWDNLLRLLLSLNLVDDEEIKLKELKMALGTFMASYPVYRAYIDGFPLSDNDRQLISLAFTNALARYPHLHYEFSILQKVFEPHPDVTRNTNRLLFIQRLMQFTGPLAAKGVEDTTFYQYNPLISHNEVGDSPCQLGISIRQFHGKMQERIAKNPHSFNCTSTHDTKRGEDGRIRINIISELSEEWKRLVDEWQAINDPYRQPVGKLRAPVVNDELFLYQAIVGGFPEDLQLTEAFITRTKTYFTKVLRESKQNSDHVEPNIAYEEACSRFIDHLLNPAHTFLPSMRQFVKKIIPFANVYTMVQVIIKITAPGIPDIYRGCELWDISYVDPDNRRPVNYVFRQKLINELKQALGAGPLEALSWANSNFEAGAQKLLVTRSLLRLRREDPDLFREGDYIPVYPAGDERTVIAYLRRAGDRWLLIVLPLGIVANNDHNYDLELPTGCPERWENIFSGEIIPGTTLRVQRLFEHFPVAILKSVGD